jgi:hypothetical protein
MNMSDDVSGAVVGISTQVAQKGIETGGKVIDKTIDTIAKLLNYLFTRNAAAKAAKSSDMTDIKPGEAEVGELLDNARKNGDTLVSTDGYSKTDMKFIAKKASEYGILVAFTNKKDGDNICAHIRGSDKAIFENICTEMLRGKIDARPQELDNFKADRWQIEGIQRELSKHDLNANWGKTKDGEYFCLFEKTDGKAIKMARGEFVRKCNEVEKDFSIEKGDDGFYTLKDGKSGKEITFDELPSKSELSTALQDKFGYDENKAEIACAKFGEENLNGDAKRKFFSDNPQNEFSKIDSHIELEGESILAKDYTCLRVSPKADGVPRIVFKDKDNNFAVLNPEKMSRAEMSETIRSSLGIEDEKAINALVDKADKANDYYQKQSIENFSLSREFKQSDFSDEALQKSSQHGGVERELPVSKIETSVERLNKENFSVVSSARYVEHKDGVINGVTNTAPLLVLSFSDKKNALFEIQKMYESQGVPADIAKQSAKETFSKAQAQSAEKVLHIEEIKADKQSAAAVMTVRYSGKVEEINIEDREKTAAEIGEKFDVSETQAKKLTEKANEIMATERQKDILEKRGVDTKGMTAYDAWERIAPIAVAEGWKNWENENPFAKKESEASEKVINNDKKDALTNGHEKTSAEPVNLDIKQDAPKAPEMPKVDIPAPTGGRRR